MLKDKIKKFLNEITSTQSSRGSYAPPLQPGLRLFDKSQLTPYSEPISKYVNPELNYDSYDGEMSTPKKDISKMELKSKKISKSKKNNPILNDDDGDIINPYLRPNVNKIKLNQVSKPYDLTEWVEITEDTISEDLAVWFGKKKKPKGSSQPKGPWVNICKKVDGKHPPCGREKATDKSYPKCRAAGVAGKMTDSQKKSACSQKRRAEKTNPKSGTGNKPKMVSYKPREKKESVTEAFKVKPDEYKKIYEDSDVLMVVPFTHTASCKYGAWTKWCTTKREDSKDFNYHIDNGFLVYVIIKNPSIIKSVESHKIALFRYFDEDDRTGLVFDERNVNYNLPWLADQMYISGLLKEYNKIMSVFNKYYKLYSEGGFELIKNN